MKKKALISGINGQDGSYLSELLLEKGYDVYGIMRRNSLPDMQDERIKHLEKYITTVYGDVTDRASLVKIFSDVKPDEVYNLAAQSHVRISFDVPEYTIMTNGIGVLNMLETTKTIVPDARFYQASSSEIFGNCIEADDSQNENTRKIPTSPYGCAKLLGFNLVHNYRNSFKMFASNGILFNHESPRRGINFVTNKVVKGAVEIKKGLRKNLALGNMDACRDWGHSKDYVRAMNIILNLDKPDDYVVSTGITHSIRDLCKYTFSVLGMNYEDYVIVDPKFFRPEELNRLRGDSTKFRTLTGWKPEYTFETMLDEMIEHWSNKIK